MALNNWSITSPTCDQSPCIAYVQSIRGVQFIWWCSVHWEDMIISALGGGGGVISALSGYHDLCGDIISALGVFHNNADTH